jgi:cellulose synthase/poly-beta-1,6-N-acetylglucosamine synthase-like glycosyltransferase
VLRGRGRGRLGLGVAALLSALWFGVAADWFRGSGRIPVLANLGGTGSKPDDYPSVSVVVAARDEREAVESALRSLLEQDYPGSLEVIAVDDRSTDGTEDVMAGLAAWVPGRLRHLRVDRLPGDWLGKNHALWLGAGEADGGWLLFTDADVRFEPDCVRLAVRHALNEGLDHLALAPELVSRGLALKSFVAAFVLVFEVTQRPWRVSDPEAKESVGVGAFNLVRREAYEGAGTHGAVRMRPDDDLRLGRALKEAGFRQGVAYGTGTVRVEWHRSLAGAVRGLGKSMFPGVDYRLSAALLASLGLFATNVLPFFGVFFARRAATRLLFGADVLVLFAMYARGARRSGTPAYLAALHPFGAAVLIFAMLRSTYKTLAQGGIEWRGTFYPLETLRRGP